jgi:Gas vesicle synthesis protein GvpL/GvpF
MARNGSGFRDGLALHLYAIVEGLPPWWRPPAQGVGGRPVLAWHIENLSVVASPLPHPVACTPVTLAQHQEVIAALLDVGNVLPVPFDDPLPEAALTAWLEERWGAVEAALRSVRDSVEMTVRLVRLEPGAPSTTAAASLRSFAERLVERAAVGQWRYVPSGRGASLGATLAFLVRRGEVTEFLARIAPLASRAAGLAVVPSGPWAPWSFSPPLEVGAHRATPELVPVARAG